MRSTATTEATPTSTSGRYDKALEDFEAALRIKPTYLNSIGGRGLARGYLGNEAGARADFAREVELDPKRTLRTLPKPVVETALVKPQPPAPPATRPYLKEYEPYITREAYDFLENYRLGSRVDAAENTRLQVAYDKAFEESRYNDVQEANHIRAIQREPVAALWKMLADPPGNNYFLPMFTPVEERLDGLKRPWSAAGRRNWSTSSRVMTSPASASASVANRPTPAMADWRPLRSSRSAGSRSEGSSRSTRPITSGS